MQNLSTAYKSVQSFWQNLPDGYRYGFNGKEKDDEVTNQDGTSYDFGVRFYNPRVGRWLSRDPLEGKYPSLSPYNFVGNSPLVFIDPDGRIIDPSALSAEEITIVNSQIELMKNSTLFATMYDFLVNSEKVYTLNVSEEVPGGGSCKSSA